MDFSRTRRFFLRHAALGSLLLGMVCQSGAAFAAEPPPARPHLSFVAAEGTVDTLISEVILREAYWRLGIDIDIARMPGERALQLANAGKVAGDVQRIDGITATYPKLVQVRPAINTIEISAFTVGQRYPVSDWNSLRPYRLGITRGIKFAETRSQEYGLNPDLSRDYPTLFKVLQGGRIDIAIAPSLVGRREIALGNLENAVELSPPIDRFKLFHYLNANHANLVPAVSAVLAEMEKSGQLERIRSHVSNVLLERARGGLESCESDYVCLESGLDFLRKTPRPLKATAPSH